VTLVLGYGWAWYLLAAELLGLGYMFLERTVVHSGLVFNLIGVGSMSGGGGIRTHE
jgi:hypothetical protein